MMATICTKKYRDLRLLCVIYIERRLTWSKEDLVQMIDTSFEKNTINLHQKNKLYNLLNI